MRPSSANLRRALRQSFDSRWVVDVFYANERKMQDVPVSSVTFDEDAGSKVQQSGSLTIVWQDKFGRSIAPETIEDLLSPFGTTLRLYSLISLGPTFSERVAMGTYVVAETPTIETSRWMHGNQARSKGDRIKVQFKDPFYKVMRNRFDVPGVTPSLGSVYDELQRLTLLPITRSARVPDAPIPRALVYDEDRLDAVYELATALDAVPYMTGDGTLSLRPNTWGDPVDTIDAENADAHLVVPPHYTDWAETRRNRVTVPRPAAYSGSGWAGAPGLSASPEAGWVGGTLTGATVPYIFTGGSPRAYAAGEKVTLSVRYRVTALDASPRWITVMPHVRTGNIYHRGGYQVTRPVVVGKDEDVVIQWVTPEAIAAGATLDIAIGVSPDAAGASLTSAAAGFGLRATRALVEDGWTDGAFFDGSTAPDGELERTRWTAAAGASASIVETRTKLDDGGEVLPHPRGTLIGVQRGMSAEGVYNRVVVRAQGQKSGVLAASEITEGPLRATEPDGSDSPFGRVPYFISSQFITTAAQAARTVRDWLPRVARPQATILTIEETFNPLREVGDVVTVRRAGEEFLARVISVGRSSGKTQTTKVVTNA